MKKQQKSNQEKKQKKKQIVNFQQRFKNKKSVVTKLGLLDLLGLQQPFDLNRDIVSHDFQPIVQVIQQVKNPEQQKKSQRRMSQADAFRLNNTKDRKLQTNKTQNIKKETKKQQKTQKLGLPRISKSSSNIMIDYSTKQAASTREYWLGKDNINTGNKKRSTSQLTCVNMMKGDQQAKHHWQNLAKIQKINMNYKKLLVSKLRKD